MEEWATIGGDRKDVFFYQVSERDDDVVTNEPVKASWYRRRSRVSPHARKGMNK